MLKIWKAKIKLDYISIWHVSTDTGLQNICMNKNNKNKNFALPIKVPQGANNLIQ